MRIKLIAVAVASLFATGSAWGADDELHLERLARSGWSRRRIPTA